MPIAEVVGCADCPLCGLVEFQIGSQAICQHKEARSADGGRYRAVADEDEPAPEIAPDWCPLREWPLTAQQEGTK